MKTSHVIPICLLVNLGIFFGADIYHQLRPQPAQARTVVVWSDNAQAMPVHRFWNADKGTHFFTTSNAEKNKLVVNYPNIWTYEGSAFCAISPTMAGRTIQFDDPNMSSGR